MLADKKPAPPEYRIRAAQSYTALREARQRAVVVALAAPVEPRDLGVVLTVRIVVAGLRIAELVPREQHRGALREHQRRQEISFLPFAQGPDLRVVRCAFGARIPRVVVGAPVAIVFVVRFVVLVVVRNEVVQRESVVRGDEVDARPRFSPAPVEEVRGCREALRDAGGLAFVAFPVRAHRVAELVVPLGPARRKLAHLISARPDVPRLGDQLHF